MPGLENIAIHRWFGGDCPILSSSRHLLKVERMTLALAGILSRALRTTIERLLALVVTSTGEDTEGMVR